MERREGVPGIHLVFQKLIFDPDPGAHAITLEHMLPPFKIFFWIKEWEDDMLLGQYLLIKVWAQREWC